MKTAILLLILALHTTGLWGRLPRATRDHLTAGATLQTAPAPIATGGLPSLPLLASSVPPPAIGAASALIIDRATATPLYSKNPGAARPIASVTKMTTIMTILSRHNLSEHVTIGDMPVYPRDAETMGLYKGDGFKLGDLVKAALVPSDNDAADALAIYDSGSTAKFAKVMNAKLAEWGITGAHFSGASGLEDKDNYASASALAKIASLAIQNPIFAETVKNTSVTIMSDQGRIYNLRTTNDLLASGKFYGIKTGYTELAGECFVGLTRIDGHEIITVVLGANDRFGDTTALTDWIGHTWKWF